ncbi:hypothetical protein DES53_11282 [Roseimicrobium gellanilyticum]|uniref:Uncharacterized protein n=1 Tax=Roseimicrobium gellanilyticum TaxID=748857 RepID=A0A366H980_9BACT|nr:hypothetical protein DES53_11282 [Roseimicrobium gellanilyticum]
MQNTDCCRSDKAAIEAFALMLTTNDGPAHDVSFHVK